MSGRESRRASGDNPYRRRGGRPGPEKPPPQTTLGKQLSVRLRDMGPSLIPDQSILNEVNPKVLELNVKDLTDLATEISGLDSFNPKVKSLTVEDRQDIEAIFYEARIKGLTSSEGAQGGAEPELFDNWSCCCCTPCCCCAAVDIDPFEDDRLLESERLVEA
jgi:hypothetical protein